MIPVTGPQPGQGQGYGVLAPGGSMPNQYAGSETMDGAVMTEATIFGYRDGDGRTGKFGDNGVGGPAVSHVSGRTNYTGNPDSQGVAVPPYWLIRDFGAYNGAKNSAYAIYQLGIHKGNFPIVDVSDSKLDLTYGLVYKNITTNITRNRSDTDWAWNNTSISYKPLPNFYATHARPVNPMIQVKQVLGTDKYGSYGMHEIGLVLPADVTKAIQDGMVNVIYQ